MYKLVLGLGGSSGAIYAKLMLERIQSIEDQISEIGIVVSRNARINWELEIHDLSIESFGYRIYEQDDFNAPFASGSAGYTTMIICPCSMGVLGRIANGLSDDLMTRAADVMLKERKNLILVPRETPFSLIHLDNMRKVTEAGAIVCPAIPSFYSRPETVEKLCLTVVDRALLLAGLKLDSFIWGNSK